MALKYQLDSIDDLPETLHEYYTESNGKYVLAVEGVKPDTEFSKVTGALNNERKTAKQLKEQLSAWQAKFEGKTADEIYELVEKIPMLEEASQGKFDKSKVDALVDAASKSRLAPVLHDLEKFKTAVAERDQRLAQYEAADKRRTIHDAIREVAAKEGFIETAYSSSDGALMLIAERFLTVDELGQVVVADDAKSLTPGLGVKEALGELKQAHPYLLKASQGGGATGSTGAVAGNNPFKTNNMTARGQYMKANPDKWQKAMQQAGLSSPTEAYKAAR